MTLKQPRPIEEAPLEEAEFPRPSPGPGEIRIAVSACGICHTDLHIVEGEVSPGKLPIVPGHQIVGRVESVGQGARHFRPEDRVGVAWLHSTCGHCSFCRRGQENLCLQARFTGRDVDGGYATEAIACEDFVFPLPENFSDLEAAPLLCAGIVGFRALRLSGIERGERLGLYGFGASAHIVIQVARHWGCQVYVFSRGEEHRRLATRLGAVWTGEPGETPPTKLHGAVIFSPAGEQVPQALQVLERGSTLALAGIYMTPIPELDYPTHLYYEKTVRTVTNSTREDARELLHLAAEIPLHTQVEVFPLSQANQALRKLKEGKIQGAGVLQV